MMQVVEQLRLARLPSKSDNKSLRKRSSVTQKSSRRNSADTSTIPLSSILDAVDTLVDERFAHASKHLIRISSIAQQI